MICEICKKESGYCIDQFSRYHLKPHHGLNSQQYYDIIHNTSETCPKCGRKRRYLSMTTGYKCCCGDGVYCHICKINLLRNDSLGPHLKKLHDMSGHEYYDLFLKKEGDGICKVCSNQTSFVSPTSGYRDYCSIQCQGKSEITKENRKNTNIKLFGVEHISHSPEIIDRIYKTKGYSDEEIKLIRDNITELELYQKSCRSLSSKIIDIVRASSNKCYYTNMDLIVEEDASLVSQDNYKNVDHIIPISVGFVNNIPAEVISSIDNLCVCSRISNMIKGGRPKNILLDLLKNYKKDKLTKEQISYFINTIKLLDF